MSKFIALAAAALLGSATFAAADSGFTLPQVQERDGIAELGRINAEGDGIVEVYATHGGEMGALLGSEMIHQGTNSDVRVSIAHGTATDAMAVLRIGGQVVATQDVRYLD